MATSNWTSQMEVTVASDVDSVIGWWTDDARRLEWRAHLETSETVLDFDYRERIDHGVRITEVKYIAAPIECASPLSLSSPDAPGRCG